MEETGFKQVRGPKASQGPRCRREFLLTSQLATETHLGPGVQTGLGVGPAPSRSQSLRDGGEEKLCGGRSLTEKGYTSWWVVRAWREQTG